jgi:hypothetical protein
MRRNRPGPNSKIGEFWNSNLNFLKKIKKSEKYVKIDEILRSLVKKFLQISDVLLVKIQNESNMTNGPTWPTAHMEAISSPSVGRTEVS